MAIKKLSNSNKKNQNVGDQRLRELEELVNNGPSGGGKVDDVKVNGVSVLSGKTANITVPTKVSDLENDADYATQEDVEESKISEVEATIDDNVGTPDVDVTLTGQKLTLAFQNLLGDGIASIEQTTTSQESEGVNVVTVTTVGGKVGTFQIRNGAKGDTVILGEGVEYTLYNGTGSNTDGAMTQKATTDAIKEIGVYEYNLEYLVCFTDSERKILWAIEKNGNIYYGKGVPQQVIDHIKKVSDAKVDKEDGKGLIDTDFASSQITVENPEMIEVTTDNEGRILSSRSHKGVKKEYVGFESPEISIGGAETKNVEDPEGRTEITTDAEGRIVSYRDNTGKRHEQIGLDAKEINTDSLTLSDNGMTEFQQALKNAGFKSGGAGDWSDFVSEDGDNPLCLPQPNSIALVNILSNVNLVNLSKSTTAGAVEGVTYNVPCQIEYYDMDGNYFKKNALMSGQGNSSMQFPKKNIALDFFDSEIDGDAFKVKFGDWVPQDSWHLKSYYTDAFRCVGLATYKIYDEMMKTRGIMADYIYKKALIDFSKIGYVANGYNDLSDMSLQFETGAKCFPDGFPIIVYQNGEFFGLYCWQIKKHRDNYHMKKSNKKHIHLDGTINTQTLFNGVIDWDADTGFEVRNPKDLYLMDGTKYDADTNSGELIDSTSQYYDANNSKHVTTAAVKKYIIDFSHVMSVLSVAKATYNASSKAQEDLAALKEVFETYFDVDNLIDYLIISDVSRNYDGFSKNWQWLTYDGVKWWVSLYDCDGCFGGNFTGTSNMLPLSDRHMSSNLMYEYIVSYYSSELENRYASLREKGILSPENMIKAVNNIMLSFGATNIEKEFGKWTNCPCNRDVVLNENWEFDLDENGNPQLGTANYNNSTTYNAGDSCFYAQYPGNGEAVYKYKAKATVTGVKPVDSFGYRDSIYRLYKWMSKAIENMDVVYSYNG